MITIKMMIGVQIKNRIKFFGVILPSLLFILIAQSLIAQSTQKLYLSGTGSDQEVKWQFYCTAGMNSGKWTTIDVPSCWELKGFGSYNYGLDKDSLRLNETGLYKYHFKLPKDCKGKVVRIVFDGSMTDTDVKINGKSAGPTHQGAFYQFKYDISNLLHYGSDNLLEVSVKKNSTNPSVNGAERKGDFWIFGGIFRPVYLEILPVVHMDNIAINALANGHFEANLELLQNKSPISNVKGLQIKVTLLDDQDKPLGNPVLSNLDNLEISENGLAQIQANFNHPRLWSPEYPNLYHGVFQLIKNGEIIHEVKKTFGFRTIEIKPRDGIYVNGIKIKFKGVNHHSFWPTTGRTTSKTQSIADVQLIKEMNMNAVRMSHYPPDEHFLDACDSLGLFVLDELTGWHRHYDTQVGSKLVKEMVQRDVNHPSIVLWDNGNEGGFNFDLDSLFDKYDIQKRTVIHPWAIFGNMDTQHYINYDYGNGTHMHGHNIVFPTEFLHGLYDGGLGAGLHDFWESMWHNPLSAGGFLWVFADEDVVRTDKKDSLDSDGDHAPDGILGPFHEKEGSFYSIREIWSPIFMEHLELTAEFNGNVKIENRYFYTNLEDCHFQWQLQSSANPLSKDLITTDSGQVISPSIAPGCSGDLHLNLPENWRQNDIMVIKAWDPHHKEICSWSLPITLPMKQALRMKDFIQHRNTNENNNLTSGLELQQTADAIHIHASSIYYEFNKTTNRLSKVINGKEEIPFNNGPVLSDGSALLDSVSVIANKDSVVITGHYRKQSELANLDWTIYKTGLLKMAAHYFPKEYSFDYLGLSFSLPENTIRSVDWMGSGPYRVWKNRMQGPALGIWHKDYNNTITGQPPIIYPEFKGYYSNLYWVKFNTSGHPFRVICADEDVFLRLYTPASPKKVYNTAPPFPNGDVSFMHAIAPIGTKSQIPDNLGPSGRKNMYYDYGKAKEYAKELILYFDFIGS